MKKLVKLSVLILLWISASSLNNLGDKFHCVEGRFKIVFDGTPQYQVQNVNTKSGEVLLHTYMTASEDVAYMVAYCDYDSTILTGQDNFALLESARDGFLGALGLDVERTEKKKLQGYPCISFKAKSSDYSAVMTDVFVKNRLYQVGILKVGDYPSKEIVGNFVGTFEVLDK